MSHSPVLLAEAIEALAPKDGALYVDATFGGGGYTRALLQAAQCRVIAIDRDPAAIARARALAQEFPGRVFPAQGRFSQLDHLAGEPVAGVVLDVGVSSFQIDTPERGFSFRFDADLDMRMEQAGASAMDAVASLTQNGLESALRDFGEEKQARRIARAIVAARAQGPLRTTGQLAQLVETALGGRKGARLHPATRTFQALRLLVNDELGELAQALNAAERILLPSGRLVVVSFHSLEDRLVKQALAERGGVLGAGSRYRPEIVAKAPSFRLLKRGGVEPSAAEQEANPRARSARLRAAERTSALAWGGVGAPDLAALALAEWSKIA
jgi:16S rRNA (cytosine1402-N4)-methyltransferase